MGLILAFEKERLDDYRFLHGACLQKNDDTGAVEWHFASSHISELHGLAKDFDRAYQYTYTAQGDPFDKYRKHLGAAEREFTSFVEAENRKSFQSLLPSGCIIEYPRFKMHIGEWVTSNSFKEVYILDNRNRYIENRKIHASLGEVNRVDGRNEFLLSLSNVRLDPYSFRKREVRFSESDSIELPKYGGGWGKIIRVETEIEKFFELADYPGSPRLDN